MVGGARSRGLSLLGSCKEVCVIGSVIGHFYIGVDRPAWYFSETDLQCGEEIGGRTGVIVGGPDRSLANWAKV